MGAWAEWPNRRFRPIKLHKEMSMRATVAALTAALLLAFVPPATAQDEDALRSFFEGRHVTLKIDMPGTSDGVDVRADAERAIDYRRYGDRLKTYGTSIRSGEPSVVTLMKLKKDVIELQLGGGGFGTFGDDTSTSVSIPRVEESRREKDLERRIKDESDSDRKREMRRELENLRDRRERENRRLDVQRERAEEIKRERVAERRLAGGSRFNLRYEGRVPPGIRPEDVMAALADYVDFSPGSEDRFLPDIDDPKVVPLSRTANEPAVRKGMLRSEAERVLGTPNEVSERREGNLSIVTLTFVSGAQRITAQFVEDVLVRYTIASK
jgi:hypothetical protein